MARWWTGTSCASWPEAAADSGTAGVAENMFGHPAAGICPRSDMGRRGRDGLTEPVVGHIVSRYPSCYSIRSPGEAVPRLNTWLRWLEATATTVLIAALCLAVALLVI